MPTTAVNSCCHRGLRQGLQPPQRPLVSRRMERRKQLSTQSSAQILASETLHRGRDITTTPLHFRSSRIWFSVRACGDRAAVGRIYINRARQPDGRQGGRAPRKPEQNLRRTAEGGSRPVSEFARMAALSLLTFCFPATRVFREVVFTPLLV